MTAIPTPDTSVTHPPRPRRVAPTPWLRRLAFVATSVALVAATFVFAPDVGAIVGGTPAEEGEYPWMVALTYPDGEQFCGGSVLAPDLVLTAAHCVVGEVPEGVGVEAGATALGDPDAQRRDVVDIAVHDDWDTNDIAILRLAEPFELNDAVQPIPMVDDDLHPELVDDGSPVTVIGWGSTDEESGAYPTDLLETDQRIVGDTECATRYADELAVYGGEIIDDAMVCANHPDGNDSCYGDSGGPLLVQDPDDGTWYQLGIVSFAITACGETAGVYTEVTGFEDFIASEGVVGEGENPDMGGTEWLEEDVDMHEGSWFTDWFAGWFTDLPLVGPGDLPGLDGAMGDGSFDPGIGRDLLARAVACAERGDVDCLFGLLDAALARLG